MVDVEKVSKLDLEKRELEAVLASFIEWFFNNDEQRIDDYLVSLEERVKRVRNL